MFNYGTKTQGVHNEKAPEIEMVCFAPRDPDVRVTVNALADTGSARTCLPASCIAALSKKGRGLEYFPVRHVHGVTGTKRFREVLVNIRLNKCDFSNVRVLEFDKPYALIGRDILNLYRITFDSERGVWEVDKDC